MDFNLAGETQNEISESLDIKQGEINYKLNMEADNENIKFQISEENDIIYVYEKKLSPDEIKKLDNIFSKNISFKEFFDYIKSQKEKNNIEISKKDEQISIKIKQKNIEINLIKENVSTNIAIKNLCKEVIKLKTNLENLENKKLNEEIKNLKLKNNELMEENKKIKKIVDNLKEENKKLIKEETKNINEILKKIIEENKQLKQENKDIKNQIKNLNEIINITYNKEKNVTNEQNRMHQNYEPENITPKKKNNQVQYNTGEKIRDNSSHARINNSKFNINNAIKYSKLNLKLTLINKFKNNNLKSILLCLSNVKTLVNYFLSNKEEIKSEGNQNKLKNSFLGLVENLWENKQYEYYLNNFSNLIGKRNPENLIKFIIEGLHNELNILKNANIISVSYYDGGLDEYFQKYKKSFQNSFKTVISDLFYFIYNTQEFCSNCEQITSNNLKSSYMLEFSSENIKEIEKENKNDLTIKDLFLYYQKKYIIFIECKKCHLYSLSKNNIIMEGPKVLIINLNTTENNIKFNLDEIANLSDFFYYKKFKNDYELINVVANLGNEILFFCKRFKDNKWYKYEKSIFTESNFNQIKEIKNPYLLVYSLIEN